MNDYGKLKHWQKLLRNGHLVITSVRKELAEETLKLIDEGFDSQRDPYGNAWAPKKRPDGRKILHGPTGRLRRGWRVKAVANARYTVLPSVDYAAPHQAPRRGRRPRRRMVPGGRRGLPPKWKARFKRVATRAMAQHYRKALRGF